MCPVWADLGSCMIWEWRKCKVKAWKSSKGDQKKICKFICPKSEKLVRLCPVVALNQGWCSVMPQSLIWSHSLISSWCFKKRSCRVHQDQAMRVWSQIWIWTLWVWLVPRQKWKCAWWSDPRLQQTGELALCKTTAEFCVIGTFHLEIPELH